MPEDPTQIDTLLARAAQMRVEGRNWSEVAQTLNRSPETVRHWPGTHPRKWRNAMVGAIEDALGDYENEALLVARQNLRRSSERTVRDGTVVQPTADDLRLAQAAARDLLRHCRDLRGTLRRIEIEGDLRHALSTTDLIRMAANGGFKPGGQADGDDGSADV